MPKTSVSKRNYPWKKKLGDAEVTLRLMTAADGDAMYEFAKSLPADDLLFLAVDITDKEAIDAWVREVKAGRTVTVLAESNGKIVGHGTLIINALTWTRHLGEIQLLVSPEFRGKGLGNILASEINAAAQNKEVQKVVARMAAEQQGARQVFERLGFTAEALLADYVIDRQNRTHDLIVMSYDVTGLTI